MLKGRFTATWLIACFSLMLSTALAEDFQDVQVKGPKNSSSQYSGVVYGPITSSDTLWQIAGRYRQNKELSIYQVMLAIYQLNPEAFEQSNINLIKNGSMLKLPSEKYASRVDKAAALARAEADSEKLKQLSPAVNSATDPTASVAAPAASSAAVSKNELDQTKEMIEQKLGALDEAQSRQFLAIRQQFAESISHVQTILEENQKLFERLDKVNNDIDELRAQETDKARQMTQMGESIEELLAKSRLEENRQRQMAQEAQSGWLDDPLTMIALTSAGSLSLLGLAAFFLFRHKTARPEDDLHLVEDDDIELDAHSAALDDLSDALSDELSEELGDELDDDNLFGDDDLLDDVLAEELRESLDEALDDSIDETFEDELENFDDLGDDILDPDSVGAEFEEGAAQIEQSELDSLFDEDDNLLAEIVDESAVPQADNSLIEQSAATDEPDEASVALSEDVAAEDPISEEAELPDAEPLIAKITDHEEPPEISIDELFDGSEAKMPEGIDADDSEELNEELLQQLDKEIASQNAELDNITGNLLDELEQVEQMRDLLGDDKDEAEEPPVVQASIKKLDEESLAEGFDETSNAFEPDFLDVLDEDDEDVSAAAQTDPDLEQTISTEVTQEDSDLAQAATESEQPETDDDVDLDELVEYEALAEDEEFPAESAPDVTAKMAEQTQPDADPEADLDSEQAEQTELADEADAAEEKEETEESEQTTPQQQNSDDDQQAEESFLAEQAAQDQHAGDLAEEGESLSAEYADDPTAQASTDTQAETKQDETAAEAISASEIDNDLTAETNSDASQQQTAEPDSEQSSDLEDLTEDEHPADATDTEELDDEDSHSEELQAHPVDDHGLDEDQLEKALEDFEHQELDDVLKDLTSSEPQSLASLDDLEFGMVADDFVQNKTAEKSTKKGHDKKLADAPLNNPDDGLPDDLTDDSLLEQALADLDADADSFDSEAPLDELDDLPGLGEWLSDADKQPAKNKKTPQAYNEDQSLLEELEEANFDELLNSIDIDDEPALHEISDATETDSGLNIANLLSDDDNEGNALADEDELDPDEDFLDVESLLNDSFDDDNQPADKELDLSAPLASFFGDPDDKDMVDVDGDSGLGAKLDLAHAYIEIGEHESAIELLEDIVEHGNSQQKSEAQAIIDSIKA